MTKVKIVAIEPRTELEPTGRLKKVYRIYYDIEGKIVDWVDIPEDNLEPDYVKSIIIEKAKKLGALLGLDVSKIEVVVSSEISGIPPLMRPM